METEGVSFPRPLSAWHRWRDFHYRVRLARKNKEKSVKNPSMTSWNLRRSISSRTSLLDARERKLAGICPDRAIASSTSVEFGLGYASANRFGLKEHLGSKGVSVSDMIETGLLIAGDDIPVPYDRFRDRIIIPIHDQRGRVVGFGGRALKSDVQPKYLNSPETSIFHKGSVVFNFHRAREPAHKMGSVVAVEGYMDAIAIYQAGIRGVVATMGTAFTEEQITTLWRPASELSDLFLMG